MNEKMSLLMSLEDIAIFKMSQKKLYIVYIWTLYKMTKRMSLQSLKHFIFKKKISYCLYF
jgi:hypothetical protein